MITFDYIMLNAFIEEQNDFFLGARINKIQQPTRKELILSLRNNGDTRQFYVNIDPKFYHLSFMSKENESKRLIEIPQKPPMFCMLLRKYLNNSRIAKINQPKEERILEIYFETYNEIGDKIYLCLAIELMGKYSNIILYNCDTDIILGCAHNVGSDKSQVREVYGTIPYTYPPSHDDTKFIQERYGFLFSFKDKIYPEDCANSVIDSYYANLTEKNKLKIIKNNYTNIVKANLKKVEKSLKEMEYQRQKKYDADKYRLWGDLIMANLYNLKDSSKSVKVFDYESNRDIIIDLNETKSLKDNANIFYKKYNKSKTANSKLLELIETSIYKKDYLQNLLYSIERSETILELNDLKDEIETDKPAAKYNKSSIEPLKINLEYETRIYIGKNNKQNDYIVSKLAEEDDLWFHTKDYPGSHVLLKTQNLTNDLIIKCAKLAKENSSAFNSSKVGVIYTKRKYLRKPPKANLGYVTYRNEKEIIID